MKHTLLRPKLPPKILGVNFVTTRDRSYLAFRSERMTAHGLIKKEKTEYSQTEPPAVFSNVMENTIRQWLELSYPVVEARVLNFKKWDGKTLISHFRELDVVIGSHHDPQIIIEVKVLMGINSLPNATSAAVRQLDTSLLYLRTRWPAIRGIVLLLDFRRIFSPSMFLEGSTRFLPSKLEYLSQILSREIEDKVEDTPEVIRIAGEELWQVFIDKFAGDADVLRLGREELSKQTEVSRAGQTQKDRNVEIDRIDKDEQIKAGATLENVTAQELSIRR